MRGSNQVERGTSEVKDSRRVWKHLPGENAIFLSKWLGSLMKAFSVRGIRAGCLFLIYIHTCNFDFAFLHFSSLLFGTCWVLVTCSNTHHYESLSSFEDYIIPYDSIPSLHTSGLFLTFFFCLTAVISSHQLSREVFLDSPWNNNAPRWIVHTFTQILMGFFSVPCIWN